MTKNQDKNLIILFFTVFFIGVFLIIHIAFGSALEPKSYSKKPLDYHSQMFLCVDSLAQEVNAYIKHKAPNSNLCGYALTYACLVYNIDVRLPLSQGLLESHFGTKGMALKTNSVWNVGAFDNYSLEEISDRNKSNHPNESIKPYLSLLKRRYVHDKSESELLLNFADSNGRRYASSKEYESKLKSIWQNINTTTDIDKFINQRIQLLRNA